jgi:hypothetical protein
MAEMQKRLEYQASSILRSAEEQVNDLMKTSNQDAQVWAT